MILPQYQVDAFASRVFQGNPAAVCPLDGWLDDAVMQAIAAENNLAETAFFIKGDDGYAIRWFTATTEVALCGHATLASAFVLFNCLGVSGDSVTFDSLSGPLVVTKKGDLLEMNFPSEVPQTVNTPQILEQALGDRVERCLFNQDYIAVLDSEEAVAKLSPDFDALAKLEGRGVIVTAPVVNKKTGNAEERDDYDFVCRFFGPKIGLNEDPVTGSAFTKLVPFWSQELNKLTLFARQVSKRGGDIYCHLNGDRVVISGCGALFSQGHIYIA